MQTVGLAIIAKDEAENILGLLESVEGAFDQIALLDTGSTDDTKDVFERWCIEQITGGEGLALGYKIDDFEHEPLPSGKLRDFSAARAAADALLDTDWLSWADCDDRIAGARNLRALANNAPAEVVALIFGYNYAQAPDTGQCVCYLKRERLVRKGAGVWAGRVHEAQTVEGAVQEVPANTAEWLHRKPMSAEGASDSSERNLAILREWVADEPENPRVLSYLAVETAHRGDHEAAMEYFDRCINLEVGWTEERAQVYRRRAQSLMHMNRWDDALDCAFESMRLMPSWPDSYLTLCEAYHFMGDHEKACQWADEVIRRGVPSSLLIVNPLDYTFAPRKMKAGSLAALGHFDAAIEIGQEAQQLIPGDVELNHSILAWRQTSKREHTASTYAMCAEQLIAHDEQLKAKILLEECIPHFATDHPRIVGLRNLIRQRLHWIDAPEAFADHYETGGSKPEDFIADENVDALNEALPRSQFLLNGALEQLEPVA